MTVTEIIELISLIVTTLGLIVSIVTAIVKGNLKNFILEKMQEAEAKQELTGEQKLMFVIEEVKNKYKIITIIMNIKKFIEKVISVTKKINYKGR